MEMLRTLFNWRVLLLALGLELIAGWWVLCVLTGKIDAVTYLAAGERLNAGHALYHLAAGDRIVAFAPDNPALQTPLLYPPLIAVLWRPLAAMPWPLGLGLWYAAASAAVLAAVWYVARDLRPAALGALVVFSAGIGSQLSGANVNGFVLLAALGLWSQSSRRPWVGAFIGLLAAIKLSPGIFILWLIGQRRWRATAWAVGALVAGVGVGILGAGLDVNLEAVDMLRSANPQSLTVAGITGISWATAAVDIVGAVSVLLLARSRLASFRAAALTLALGAPAVSLLTAAYGLLLVPPAILLNAQFPATAVPRLRRRPASGISTRRP